MDWGTDPVFKAVFRKAEQADTRLGIRRDEKRGGERKSSDHAREELIESAFEEERPTVSVAALTVFLEGLVQTLRLRSPGVPTPDHVVPTILPPQESVSPRIFTPGESTAVRAANAYRHIAGARAGREGGGATSDLAGTVAGQADALSASDIRKIHGLLDVLRTLRAQTLTIDKAPTFLDSLADALEKAKKAEESALPFM